MCVCVCVCVLEGGVAVVCVCVYERVISSEVWSCVWGEVMVCGGGDGNFVAVYKYVYVCT